MSKTNSNNKKVIALVLEDIFTDFAKSLIEEAKRAIPPDSNIRLVVIAGKYVSENCPNKTSDMYNAVYNTVFRLGAVCDIDGLIIHIGSLDDYKMKAIKQGLLSGLKDIPMILISSELEGYTTVGYDNRSGIREAIDGIVNLNGITKLCMLGGRDDNYEARQRKQIFIDCLKEHGIMFRNKMFEATDMSVDTEKEADRLLDNNPEARAVFCVNDASAVGLYRAMEKRRLTPGKDILVFGFDNTVLASEMKPSLSSIGADKVTIGQRAVELLLAKMNGEEVRSELVPTKLYGRSSFEYTMYEYNAKELADVNSLFIYRMFDECFYKYGNYLNDRESVNLKRLYFDFISRILVAMNSRYLSIEDYNEICRLIDIFFDEGAMEYTDSEKLLSCIGRLQEGIVFVQRMRSVNVNTYINRLFLHMKDKAIASLSEMNIQSRRYVSDFESNLNLFIKEVQFPDRGIKHLLSRLSGLGIMNAAVYLFDEPIEFAYANPELFPENITLACSIKNGETYLPPADRGNCRVSEIFSHRTLSSECRAFAVFPIFFRKTIYGFLLSEADNTVYTRGEYIASLIGRTMYLDSEK